MYNSEANKKKMSNIEQKCALGEKCSRNTHYVRSKLSIYQTNQALQHNANLVNNNAPAIINIPQKLEYFYAGSKIKS